MGLARVPHVTAPARRLTSQFSTLSSPLRAPIDPIFSPSLPPPPHSCSSAPPCRHRCSTPTLVPHHRRLCTGSLVVSRRHESFLPGKLDQYLEDAHRSFLRVQEVARARPVKTLRIGVHARTAGSGLPNPRLRCTDRGPLVVNTGSR